MKKILIISKFILLKRKLLVLSLLFITILNAESCNTKKDGERSRNYDNINQKREEGRNYELCQKFKGMSLPSWNKTEYESERFAESLKRLKSLGINSIAIIPTIYQNGLSSSEIIETEQTAADEALKKAISEAKKLKFCILLKPHVDPIPLTYRGFINPQNIEKWKKSYFDFMLKYAKIAEENKVEMFAVGTELEYLSSSKPELFSELIDIIRNIFSGKLIYAANFTEYKKVQFWEKLDFIGIDAYFHMCSSPNPTLSELKKRWNEIMSEIMNFSDELKKEVVFTEIGYVSKKGTCQRPYDWTIKGEKDEEEQALLYEAAIKFAFPKIKGMFWWEWQFYSDNPDPEGYTPRSKKAEEVLSKW